MEGNGKPSNVFAIEAEDLIVVQGQVIVKANFSVFTLVGPRLSTFTSRRPEDRKTISEVVAQT